MPVKSIKSTWQQDRNLVEEIDFTTSDLTDFLALRRWHSSHPCRIMLQAVSVIPWYNADTHFSRPSFVIQHTKNNLRLLQTKLNITNANLYVLFITDEAFFPERENSTWSKCTRNSLNRNVRSNLITFLLLNKNWLKFTHNIKSTLTHCKYLVCSWIHQIWCVRKHIK